MKKTITTITLAIVLTFGTTFAMANDGIIVAGKADTNTCSSSRDGIIVAGRDGIIVAGITGIIVAGFSTIFGDGPAPCTAEREGILVSD